jgi:hypothetical protein
VRDLGLRLLLFFLSLLLRFHLGRQRRGIAAKRRRSKHKTFRRFSADLSLRD